MKKFSGENAGSSQTDHQIYRKFLLNRKNCILWYVIYCSI